MLFSLTGDMPWSAVVATYRRWAKAENYPYRTERALRRKVHISGYSCKSTGEWLDTAAIGAYLGIEGNSVRRWVRNNWLPAYREGIKWYVSREKLRRFAKQRPDLFQERPEADLLQLLCDPILAKQLANRHARVRHGKRLPICCLETGKVYASMADAADAIYVRRQSLSRAMRENRPCAGYHWQFLPQDSRVSRKSAKRSRSIAC